MKEYRRDIRERERERERERGKERERKKREKEITKPKRGTGIKGESKTKGE